MTDGERPPGKAARTKAEESDAEVGILREPGLELLWVDDAEGDERRT